MTLHINDAGTWRAIREVHVNDAGTWRRIQEIWVNDSGTWRRVFVGDQISISNAVVSASTTAPANASATYTLESDGDIVSIESPGSGIQDIGDWIAPKINMANYECRATMISGSLTSGTTGSWLPLTSNRSWVLTETGTNVVGASFTLEIRRASDGVVMDSATIVLEADTTVGI